MATRKLTDEQVTELRTAIWASMNIATPITPLDEDDMRRTQVCSNARSPHCPGEKATHRRAGKVLCATCATRTGKLRAKIETRAEIKFQDAIKEIVDGKKDFPTTLAAWS